MTMREHTEDEYRQVCEDNDRCRMILREKGNVGRGLRPRRQSGYVCKRIVYESRTRHGSNMSDVYVVLSFETPYVVADISPDLLMRFVSRDFSQLLQIDVSLERHSLDNDTCRYAHQKELKKEIILGKTSQGEFQKQATLFDFSPMMGKTGYWDISFCCSDVAAAEFYQTFVARHCAVTAKPEAPVL